MRACVRTGTQSDSLLVRSSPISEVLMLGDCLLPQVGRILSAPQVCGGGGVTLYVTDAWTMTLSNKVRAVHRCAVWLQGTLYP